MFRMLQVIAAVTALLVPVTASCNEAYRTEAQGSEEFEIIKRYETATQTSAGSTSSSRGHDAYLERVIEVRDGDLELEYDLPRDATAEERARNWHFPVRVYRNANGSMQLLNGQELEARLDEWLLAAGWTRSVCGQWIFTWNAFFIDCDPQSIMKLIEELDLRSVVVREGAAYRVPEALSSGVLARRAAGPSSEETYVSVMEIDPDAVLRARAESDVALGEILQTPVTFDDALSGRAEENVTGKISVTLETESGGRVWRRTKETELEIRTVDGEIENQTATEIVERRSLGSRSKNGITADHDI